jgi:putative methyltransferase (TIGR04325 family)
MKSRIRKIPGIRSLHRLINQPLYKRRFSTDCYGCFWEVFETFEDAIAAAPKTKSVGYDNPDLAQEYVQMIATENWEGSSRLIHTYDYPILFWLNTLLNNEQVTPSIFDFGGNIGVHFYSYSKYIQFPDSLKWTVGDLPNIVEAGKDFLEQSQNQTPLSFTSDFSQIDGHKILLASGSLQYVKNFADLLKTLRQKPEHLLINRLPLYDGDQFVTLQNGGKVFYPQYVFNKAAFVESLQSLSYELVDSWEDRQTACMIPFHPEKSVPHYHGLYFRNR